MVNPIHRTLFYYHLDHDYNFHRCYCQIDNLDILERYVSALGLYLEQLDI